MVSINKTPILAACICLTLTGCGLSTSMVKVVTPHQEEVKKEVVKQVETLKYLPSQAYDKEGNKIPYQPAENPYLAMKGQIPQTEVNLYIAAISANRRGHLELARKKLEKLTEMSAELSGPWVKLGQVAKEEGKVEEAEGHFRKALEINDKNVNAYIDLALILREQGKFLDAQNVYAQALKVWPDFPEAHLNLGVLYDLYLNQPENAQAHYEAYLFLTEYKNATVKGWLSEVQNRTGIRESFIDTPPLPSDKALPGLNEKDKDVETAKL